jgi:hypothetical protein
VVNASIVAVRLMLVVAISAACSTGKSSNSSSPNNSELSESSNLPTASSLRSALTGAGANCSATLGSVSDEGTSFGCQTNEGKISAYVFPEASKLQSWRSGLTDDQVICSHTTGIMMYSQALSGDNWIVTDDSPDKPSTAVMTIATKVHRVAQPLC